MEHESFGPGMLRSLAVPGIQETNGRDIGSIKVRIKLADMSSHSAWYIHEANHGDGTCFGWVVRDRDGMGPEGMLEYFQLKELNRAQGRWGISIKRSKTWNPQTSLSEVMEGRVE